MNLLMNRPVQSSSDEGQNGPMEIPSMSLEQLSSLQNRLNVAINAQKLNALLSSTNRASTFAAAPTAARPMPSTTSLVSSFSLLSPPMASATSFGAPGSATGRAIDTLIAGRLLNPPHQQLQQQFQTNNSFMRINPLMRSTVASTLIARDPTQRQKKQAQDIVPLLAKSTNGACCPSANINTNHKNYQQFQRGAKQGLETFPEKLHRLLVEVERAGKDDIISFTSEDGFSIHKPDRFFKEIIPVYFRQTRLSSFKRQLKLYNFESVGGGGYRHDLFSKSKPELCRRMKRASMKVQPDASVDAKVIRKKQRDAAAAAASSSSQKDHIKSEENEQDQA